MYPNGHFVRSIGPIGELETEISTILIEHELASIPFSKALLKGRLTPLQLLYVETNFLQ